MSEAIHRQRIPHRKGRGYYIANPLPRGAEIAPHAFDAERDCAECGGSGGKWKRGRSPHRGLPRSTNTIHRVQCEACAGTGRRISDA